MQFNKVLFCAMIGWFSFNKLSADVITINLYINTNQCANCNIALSSLTRLSDNIIKNIYFTEANRAASTEMMEPYSEVKNLHLKYFEGKSNPFRNDLLKSYYILFKNKTKIDSVDLNGLFTNTKQINALAEGSIPKFRLVKKIPIPDSIKLSNRLTVFANNHRLSICDYLLNKNVSFNIKKDFVGLTDVIQIKGSAFKPYPFLNAGIIDTVLYRKIYADLKYLGKTKPEINASFLSDSSLYLFLTFPCGIVREIEKDTGVGGKFFLYRKDLITRKSQLFPIVKEVLPSFLGEEYWISNGNPFYVKEKRIYFTLYQEELKKENNFLAEHTLSNGKVIFKALLNYRVSDSTYLNTNFGNSSLFSTGGNTSFYFASYQPYIIDLRTNVVYNFEKALPTKSKHDLAIRDVSYMGGDLLRILVNFKNVEKCLVYDTRKNLILSEIELKPVMPLNLETIKFINYKTLVAFDESNKNLIIFEIN